MYFICPKSEAKVHRLDYEPQNNESYQCASMPSAMLSHIIDHVETRPRREMLTRPLDSMMTEVHLLALGSRLVAGVVASGSSHQRTDGLCHMVLSVDFLRTRVRHDT
jgi:hypothetical protein